MATWLQQFGNWNTNANASIFGGADAANVMHQASGFGKAMSGLGINAGSIGGIANTIGQIGTGLLAGQNQTGVGNALQTIGGLASNIPGVGGLIGAGVGVVGGLVNAAFGSHINKEFVSQTENQINQLGNRIFNGNTNADLLNDWNNYFEQSYVTKKEVGSDGWFSNKAKKKRNALNEAIDEANERQLLNYNIAVQNADQNTDLRILQGMQAYGGPINSFRKYYAEGGSLFDSPEFFTFEPQTYAKGGYLNQAKALIRQNEGWSAKPYTDSPKGRNWRSVGYGFNDSGFRDKYPEGISKHYEHGITKKQAEEELDYFLNKAEKQLKSIYGKQWNDFTDRQKAAILDTYYQRPASVGKSSRFYKAVTAGEDAGKYLGVAGFDKRNKIRQGVFGGSQDYVNLGAETENPSANSSSLQEVTPFTPVVHDLDLSGITPTQVKAPQISLNSPTFDLSMFGSTPTKQESYVPTVGTVEDFLASYGDFEENLFDDGGWMNFFQSWNQAKGGNDYFSQGNGNWKPSDGLQKNTSNGSVGDWMGQAQTTINTITNWGKEDPSLGRGGGYSMFGMAAYDVMKAIRDATKSKRESIDQKLGIPVYARGGRLFEGGGSMGAMGYAQIANSALKLASNAKAQASLDVDEDKIDRSINRFGQGFDEIVGNVNTNGDLLDLWQQNETLAPNLTTRDFRDKSYFDDFLNGYAASWEGFNAGSQTGNPYITAAAAIVGGLSSNIASFVGRNKAKHAARDTNRKIEEANERRMDNLLAAAERVDEENDLRILQNMGANGGKLNMGFGLRNPFVMPDGTANPLYKAFGGGLTHKVGDVINVSPEEARYLKSLGYEFNTVG